MQHLLTWRDISDCMASHECQPLLLVLSIDTTIFMQLANFESVAAVLGIAHTFGFATTSDGRRLLTVGPRGEAVAPETTAQLLTFCFLALFCVSRLAAAGKVHGDISPGNFTMVSPGLPLLIDLHTLQPSGEVRPFLSDGPRL